MVFQYHLTPTEVQLFAHQLIMVVDGSCAENVLRKATNMRKAERDDRIGLDKTTDKAVLRDCSDSNLKTPAAWCDKFGIEIIDNDGWNRRNPHCMEVPISLSEFISRYFVSTGRIVDRVKYAQYQYLF